MERRLLDLRRGLASKNAADKNHGPGAVLDGGTDCDTLGLPHRRTAHHSERARRWQSRPRTDSRVANQEGYLPRRSTCVSAAYGAFSHRVDNQTFVLQLVACGPVRLRGWRFCSWQTAP